LKRAGDKPNELSTDAGAEFKTVFPRMLEKHDITQRYKEAMNDLAVVDRVIRTLKETIARDMTAKKSESWSKSLPFAVKAYNNNSHQHLLESTPSDV